MPGAAQLQVTLSSLLATGVVRIHLVWGKYEEGGLPEDIRAVCHTFRAAGMAIAEHVMDRELWERTRGPYRRVHNANYFSALSVATQAAPGLPLLVIPDVHLYLSAEADAVCTCASAKAKPAFCKTRAALWAQHVLGAKSAWDACAAPGALQGLPSRVP